MKTGTKVGWILVAVSIIISVWVLSGGVSKAVDSIENEGNEFNLALSADGTHYIVTGCNCADTDIVIPATASDGLPISEVAAGAFSPSNITSVVAPGVCIIGESAFSDCPYLESVEFSNAATTIGKQAFSGCGNLASISLTQTEALSIGEQAFAYCTRLGGLKLSAGVTYLEPSMFEGCSGLRKLDIDAANPNYSSDGVAIYSKDMSKLMLVPAAATNGEGGKYEVFSGGLINGVDYPGCREIAAGAFDCCSTDSLPNLYVPATVTTWGHQTWAPRNIYLAAGYETDLYKNQIFPNYWGNGTTSIYGSYEDGDDPGPGPGPGPIDPDPPGPDDPTYTVESITENIDGTVDLVFSGPGIDAGSVKVNGVPLIDGQYSITQDASGKTVIKLSAAYVNTLRPATGTTNNTIDFTYKSKPYSGTFTLKANSMPTPTPGGEYAITKIVKSSNGQVKIYFSAPGVESGTVGGYTLVPGSNCSVMSSATTGTVITLYKDFVDTLRDVYGSSDKIPVYLTYDKKSYTKDFTLGSVPSSGGTSPSTGGGSSSGTGTVTHLYGSGTTTTTTAPVGYTTASSATGTTHTKDTTPSTADGWDARLAFAIAVLLAGVVVLMLSRRNAAKLATIKRDREGEGK